LTDLSINFANCAKETQEAILVVGTEVCLLEIGSSMAEAI